MRITAVLSFGYTADSIRVTLPGDDQRRYDVDLTARAVAQLLHLIVGQSSAAPGEQEDLTGSVH